MFQPWRQPQCCPFHLWARLNRKKQGLCVTRLHILSFQLHPSLSFLFWSCEGLGTLAGKQRRVFYSSAKTEGNHFPLSWSQRVSVVACMRLRGVGMMLLRVAASPGAVHYHEVRGKMLVVDAGMTLLTTMPRATIWSYSNYLGWVGLSSVPCQWCCLLLREPTCAWRYSPIPGVLGWATGSNLSCLTAHLTALHIPWRNYTGLH